MSIIGKKYLAFDNSYILNLSINKMYKFKNPLFAPCDANPKGIITTIVSEPYLQTISRRVNISYKITVYKVETHLFVNVLHDNHVYRILYNPEGVDKKINGMVRNTSFGWIR